MSIYEEFCTEQKKPEPFLKVAPYQTWKESLKSSGTQKSWHGLKFFLLEAFSSKLEDNWQIKAVWCTFPHIQKQSKNKALNFAW